MKIAITCWGSRVSPLFDTTRKVIIIDIDASGIQSSGEVDISLVKPFFRAGFLQDMGVEVLICGGISECYHQQLSALKIKVVPWISGEIDEIISEYVKTL